MILEGIDGSSGGRSRIGPFSDAIRAGGFVFCSGQLGIDPESGAIPEGAAAQTDMHASFG